MSPSLSSTSSNSPSLSSATRRTLAFNNNNNSHHKNFNINLRRSTTPTVSSFVTIAAAFGIISIYVSTLVTATSSSPTTSENNKPTTTTTTTTQAPFKTSPPPPTNSHKKPPTSDNDVGDNNLENMDESDKLAAEDGGIRSPLGDTMYWWFPTQYSLSNARFDGSVALYNKHFLLVGGCVDSNCETESSYMDLINPLPPGNVTDLGVLPINLYVNITKLSIRKAAAEAASHTTTPPVVTLGTATNNKRRSLSFLEEIDNEEETLHYFIKKDGHGNGRMMSTNTQLHTLLRRPQEPHVSVDPRSMTPQPPRKLSKKNLQSNQPKLDLEEEQYRQDLIREAQIAADIVERQLLVSGQYSAQIVSNYNVTDEGITFGNTIWTVGPCTAFYPANIPSTINITTTPPTSTPFAAGAAGSSSSTSSTFPPFNPSASSSSGGGGSGGLTPQEIERAFLISKHRGLWALNTDLQTVNESTSITNQFALRANASCVSYLNRIFIVGGANIDNRPGYRCRRGSLPLSDRIKKFGPSYAAKNSQERPLHPQNPDNNKHFINSREYDEDTVINNEGLSNVGAGSCPSVSSTDSSSSEPYVPVLFDTIDAFDVRTMEYQPDLISFKTPRMNSGVNVDNALLYIAGGQMVVSTTAGSEAPPLTNDQAKTNTGTVGNSTGTNYTVVACPDVEGLLFSLFFLYNESAPFTYVPLPSNPILEIINGFHLSGGLSDNQLQLLSSETASRSSELVRLRGLYSGYTSTDLSVWAISKIFSYTGEIIMTTGMSAIAFLPCYPINYTLTPGLFPTSFQDVPPLSSSANDDEDEQDVDLQAEIDGILSEFSYLLHPNSAASPKTSTTTSSVRSTSSVQDPPPSDVGSSSCINASGFPTTWGFTYTNSDVLRSSILEIPMTVFAGRIFLTFIALGGEDAAGNAVVPIIRQRSMTPEGSLHATADKSHQSTNNKKKTSPFLNSKPKTSDQKKNIKSSGQLGVDFPTSTINQLSTSISSISPVDILPYYIVGQNTSIEFFEWTQPALIRFSPNSACYTNAGGVLDMYLPGSAGRSSAKFTPLFESGAVYLCMSLGQTNISYFSIPLDNKHHDYQSSTSSGNGTSAIISNSSKKKSGDVGDLAVKVILYGCLNPLQPFQFLLAPPSPSTTPEPTQNPNNNNNAPTTFKTWIANSTHAIAFSLIVVTMAAVLGMLLFFVYRARRKSEKKKKKRGKKDAFGRAINDSDDDTSSIGGGANGLFSVNATDISGRFALDNDDAVVRNTTLDSRYRIKKRIGQGSFSSVYLVKRKSDSCEFAMKYLICGNDRDRLEAIKECETINSIQGHPNIIALYDMFMNYEFNPIPATPAQSVLSDPGTGGNGGGLGVPMTINNNNNQQQHQQVGHHQVGTPQFIRNNIAQTRLLEGAAGGGGGYGGTTNNHGGVSPPLYAAPAATPPPLPPLPPNGSSHLSPTKPKANVHTRYLCLVMEYHKSGDLCHYLLKNSATSRELFRQAFREFQQQQQIANGGAHHQAGVPFESGSSSYYSNNSTAAMPSQTPAHPQQYQNTANGLDGGAVTSGDLHGSFGAYTPPSTSPNLIMANSPNIVGTNSSPNGSTSNNNNNARAPRYQPLGESALLSVTMQLCSALHHLHSCRPAPIVHRDLKPENVLIRGALPNRHDTYIPVLITDFGLAFLQEENRRSGRGGGTRPYISPESWKGQTTIASDMWSLGCVLYALATERLTADTVRVMFEDVKRAKFQDEIMYDLVEDHGYSLEFAHLVVSLLDADPKKRPTAGSLLKRFVEVDPAHSQKLSSGRSGATPYGSLRSDGQEDNGRTTTPSPSIPNKNSKNDMDGGNSTSSGGNSDHRLSRENSGFSNSHDEDSNRSFSASESSSCYNHPDPQRRKFVVLLPPAPSSQSSFAATHGQPASSSSAAAPGTTRSSGASGRKSPATVTRTRSSGGSSSTHTARKKGSRQGSGLSRKKRESGENGAAPPTPPRRGEDH